MAAAAVLPPQEPLPLSEGQRLSNVFFAPSKTFIDLRRSASWWVPFLITAVISVLFVYTVDQKVGFRKVADNQLQTQPKRAAQVESLPPDQREQQMEKAATFTKIISYCFSIFILGWYAIVALVLLGSIRVAGADVKYSTVFALVNYAGLPGLIKSLLAIVSLLAGVSSDGFTFQNPAATNPGYFVDAVAHPVLNRLLTSFDVFVVWTLAVAAIGITCISKVKRGTAFAIVFGWYALLIVIGVAFAAAFS